MTGPKRIQRRRTKDPRAGTDRACYYCHQTRATPGQNGFCGPTCRFWSKVQKSPDCWLWTGGKHNKKGYGRFDARGERWLAHRYAFAQSVGDIADGNEIDHRCGNTRCVRPDHLESITSEEHDRRSDQGAYLRRRTHCPAGHEYTEPNTRWSGSHRHCRTCDSLKHRKDRSHAETHSAA